MELLKIINKEGHEVLVPLDEAAQTLAEQRFPMASKLKKKNRDLRMRAISVYKEAILKGYLLAADRVS
jgi:hypothetical protein